MKQILQQFKSGRLELVEVPCPRVGKGQILIQTKASLISAGMERTVIEFSKANLIQKAHQQPERVKQVLDKIETDGLIPTLEAVFRKLDEPVPLGYCNAGVVLQVGEGVYDIQPGDRVASNGLHAEVVCVPRNLCAKIPDPVSDEQASFTVLGSIALQALRLAVPLFGEKYMVFGMGLIGLLAVQLLRANGCQVLGVDINLRRLELARTLGAETVNAAAGDPVIAAQSWSGGRGVDGVLITASARNDQIVHQAAQSCRKRGRIILVGVVDLNLRRSDFYENEISFQVSCSYGPGRYDEDYEYRGHDYPLGFVRWTEQRNFEAVLRALANKKLNVELLITHRYKLDDALKAYETIESDHSALGVILKYGEEFDHTATVQVTQTSVAGTGQCVVGIIGAGNFAVNTILPCLKRTNARLKYIAGKTHPTAVRHAAKKFAVEYATTDYRKILSDYEVNTVFVVTSHDSHARMVIEALQAGKHVFVEKPLAIFEKEVDAILEAVSKAPDRLLMVGYNRRYSPHTQKIKELLSSRSESLCINMTVNAGEVSPDHWIQDPERGGGRIIGEACHFIDLLSYIADSFVVTVSAVMVGGNTAVQSDKMSIVFGFADGSVGTVNYFANGSKSYPKEILEIFSDGRTLRMENFRITRGYGFKGFRKFRSLRQDKGHRAEVMAFIDRVATGGESLIPFNQLADITRVSLAAVESARTKRTTTLKCLRI